MKKRIVILIVAAIILLGFIYLNPLFKAATGYAAKYTCSHTFLSNIDQQNVTRALDFFPVNLVSLSVDKEKKTVTASLAGFLGTQVATYYESGRNCGCVVGHEIPSISATTASIHQNNTAALWPRGNRHADSIPSYIDTAALNQVLANSLSGNANIHAIVVAYDTLFFAEHYQTGVNENSRLLGWSMTKTVGSALLGILNQDQLIDIHQPTGLKAWEQDDRKNITINNLLQMSSGLKWEEEYSSLSDATRMLYLKNDFSKFAISSPSTTPPNSLWYYSSGTSNILSKIFQNTCQEKSLNYTNFPYERLFDKINMNSALIEWDNTGNYVFSSYCWATARDWTRFGLLYLYNGNWFGDQIFSKDWSTYSSTAAPASDNKYGAQIWLKQPNDTTAIPNDAYSARGFGGQRVLVIPSKKLVITVLSGKEEREPYRLFLHDLYVKIFNCFEQE